MYGCKIYSFQATLLGGVIVGIGNVLHLEQVDFLHILGVIPSFEDC